MKKTRTLSLMLAVLMLIFAFAGCSEGKKDTTTDDGTTTPLSVVTTAPESENTPSIDPDGTHTIVDHAGFSVEIPNTVNRVVVCEPYPLASVICVFCGSADKIVGMAPACMSAAKTGLMKELYPTVLNAKTDFMQGTSVNIEELIKLEPDVVFYSSTSATTIGEELKTAGFAAVAVSADKWNYNAIETLNNWILLLDQIFLTNKSRTELVKSYSENIYNLIQTRVKDIPDAERKRVFFLFQYNDTAIMTSGKNFFGQWWCDAIGAKNVGEELTKSQAVPVNMEQIYAWDPEVIFITNFTTATPSELRENKVGPYDWSGLTALKSGTVAKMPLGVYRTYTAGVDTPITLLFLAKETYPELFSDIDLIAEIQKYYKEVFDIELSAERAKLFFGENPDTGDVPLVNQ